MNVNTNYVNTMYERYTVLNHSFNTLRNARGYIQQIVDNGKCKALPTIKAWEEGLVATEWEVIVEYGEVHIRPVPTEDFTHIMPQRTIDIVNKMETDAENRDDDTVIVVPIEGFYYAQGASAFNIARNFGYELQNKNGFYITRFTADKLVKVMRRITANGYKFISVTV